MTNSKEKPVSLKLFQGTVSHARFSPKKLFFRYDIRQIWINIGQLDEIDQISRWWSNDKPNLVQFSRQNYLPSDKSLYDEVCSTIKRQTGNDFSGEAYLLANLSYWGHCFNPVVFFCCYEDNRLAYLIAEVHNTPWNERFCYVHHTAKHNADHHGTHVAEFEKSFHVSPFMPMNLKYQWRYKIDHESFNITMKLSQEEKIIFNATMCLKGTQLTQNQANLLPFRYPLACITILAAIYWQAFRLWWKKVPIYPHPKSQA